MPRPPRERAAADQTGVERKARSFRDEESDSCARQKTGGGDGSNNAHAAPRCKGLSAARTEDTKGKRGHKAQRRQWFTLGVLCPLCVLCAARSARIAVLAAD